MMTLFIGYYRDKTDATGLGCYDSVNWLPSTFRLSQTENQFKISDTPRRAGEWGEYGDCRTDCAPAPFYCFTQVPLTGTDCFTQAFSENFLSGFSDLVLCLAAPTCLFGATSPMASQAHRHSFQPNPQPSTLNPKP